MSAAHRLLVADTGPLRHLHEAGALFLVPMLGETWVPPAVMTEFSLQLPAVAQAASSWLKLAVPSVTAQQQASKQAADVRLDSGELEAIALALDLNPDAFLTDDLHARQAAQRVGLNARGSLGVILLAAEEGLVRETEATVLLQRLARTSLWIDPAVLREARTLLADIFPRT